MSTKPGELQRERVFAFVLRSNEAVPGPTPGSAVVRQVWKVGLYVVFGVWLLVGVLALVLNALGRGP